MPYSSELAVFIDAKIRHLQDSYVRGDRKASAGPLAQLRRAITTEPGADPTVWQFTLDGLPPWYVGHTDAASNGERAAHSAMTLYAIHQQSQPRPMHVRGRSMGRSLRELGLDQSIKRRFDALMTAVTYAELTHHARGLISQLRAADIPLDYGQFAEDLRLLQDPEKTDSVRLRWGRDYYRRHRPDAGQHGAEQKSTQPEGAS